MPYIYRYLDKNDKTYKYVGISKNKCAFRRRINAHKADWWHGKGKWYIDYAFVASKSDVEFLEGVLIARLGTWAWYNKAKVTWGDSALFDVPELKWEMYESENADCLHTPEDTNVEDCESLTLNREPWAFKKERQDLFDLIEKEKSKRKKLEENVGDLEKELDRVKGENEFLRDCNSKLRESNVLLGKNVASLNEERKSLEKRISAMNRELNKRQKMGIGCRNDEYKRLSCIAASSGVFSRKTS